MVLGKWLVVLGRCDSIVLGEWLVVLGRCDSMVLGEWLVVLGRIVVPSDSGSSGVWLDPEGEGTSHTVTQCLVPKDLNLPTSTIGNLGSPLPYISPPFVISVTENTVG